MRRALLPPSLRTSTLCLSANSCNARILALDDTVSVPDEQTITTVI
ncbi:hypothetical protein AAHJ33_004797, partial [Escherichia coli]